VTTDSEVVIASLFRTMGIVSGLLGTFEATSVIMLRATGVDLAVLPCGFAV
jgi:hypothetical protein